jgi:hypothetical protein
MPNFQQIVLAATGSTSNNTDGPVSVIQAATGPIALEFIIEVAGSTPTITFNLQGSYTKAAATAQWVTLALLPAGSDTIVTTATKTAVGSYVYFVAQQHSRCYPFYRSVTSSNTNVTYRSNLQVAE